MRNSVAVRIRPPESISPTLSLVPAPATEAVPRRRCEALVVLLVSAGFHLLLVGAVSRARAAEPSRPPAFKVEVSLARPAPPPRPPEVPPQVAKPRPRPTVRPRTVAAPPPPVAPSETPAVQEESAATGIAPVGPEGTVVAQGEGPVGTGAIAGPVTAPAPPPPVIQAHEGANYLNNPRPSYPPLALERGWQGQVLLRVQVGPDGRPVSINVQRSSGRQLLDDAAVATVRGWTFVPARQGTRAIAGWVTVPIVFQLQ